MSAPLRYARDNTTPKLFFLVLSGAIFGVSAAIYTAIFFEHELVHIPASVWVVFVVTTACLLGINLTVCAQPTRVVAQRTNTSILKRSRNAQAADYASETNQRFAQISLCSCGFLLAIIPLLFINLAAPMLEADAEEEEKEEDDNNKVAKTNNSFNTHWFFAHLAAMFSLALFIGYKIAHRNEYVKASAGKQ